VTASDLRRARSFAPAHVTGLFSPAVTGRDPRARGSVGAGLVLDLGVIADASWRPGGRRAVRLTSDLAVPLPISEEVARRLLGERSGVLRIRLTHGVPVARGLGSSAAGALAVALAAGRVLGVPRRRAVETAHLADLFGGGGLGGVAAILGGGLEVRMAPGVPPFGRVIHRPFRSAVTVGIAGGPLLSPRILRNPRALARISGAFRDFADLAGRPDAERFWDLSERFTDRVGLASRELRDVVRGLRRRGARAAQAMLGHTFFASIPHGRRSELYRWLAGRRIPAVETGTDLSGARLLPTVSRR
jgi:pantoate kinase